MIEGHPPITNIKALNQSFNSSQVAIEPWSDSYWPHYRGLIATRFSDPRLPDTKSWPTHHNFYLSHSAESYINSGRVNQLSPAEKYDLLIGDRNWTLTKHMWALGRGYMNQYNFVPTWVGICQGWGAASQIGLPSPEMEITVMDVNQTTSIKFNRFDITALVSYLWAKPQGEDRFTGRRCRNPNNKDENGRVLDGACFDNNPMTWHLAVVNRVGALKKAFVMDIESQAEVWNYVIDSYNINYFNPASMEFSSVLEDSIISVETFPSDPFKSYRGPETKYIVGVMMDVFYPGAVSPHSGMPSKQLLESKRFVYDLELDSNFEVVGGEWHSEDHSDFIWLYPEVYNPFLFPDQIIQIDPNPEAPPVDQALAEKARASSQRGRVLEEIVYKLLLKSVTTQ